MSRPSPRPARRRLLLWTQLLIAASLFLQPAMPVVSAASSRALAPARATGSGVNMNTLQAGPVPTTPGGLDIILSEGSEAPQQAITSTATAGEPLSAEETAALLDRLPPLEQEAGDEQEFRLPPDSLPPPSPQTEIDVPFPPPAEALTGTAPTEVEAGDLEVLRFAPEGAIAIAPFLQVTFNQPMIFLGTIEQLSAEDVPVTITPQLTGEWKWLGTKTLTFEYKGESGDPAVDRFPMATEYTVEIPEGTTSAIGGVLKEAVRWTFLTPPASVRITYPGAGPQSRDPLMFVGFDQLIDPEAVLNTITVVANGSPVDVRLAAPEEVAADPRVTDLTKQAGEGRWLAFRAVEELPSDATINVNIGPNTPSAEGPLVTDRVQSFSFQTYGPLRIVSSRCSWNWNSDLCPPSSPFEIEFNNPLDASRFNPEMVAVSPEIPGMTVNVFGTYLQIAGGTAARSTYEVTVRGDIPDIFGQTLGESQSFTFKTDRGYPMLTGPSQSLVTLDPTSDPVFSVYSINYPRLHVRIYAVTPDDWQRWLAYQRDYWSDNPPTPPGELVIEETVQTGGEGEALVQTDIDLQRALGDSETGHLVVIVDIPAPLFGERDRSVVQAWVQITQIAIDAFSDSNQLIAWVTRLADGVPQPGVQVELYGTRDDGITAEDGTVNFELGQQVGYMLVATQAEGETPDTAILPRSVWDYWGDSGWTRNEPGDELRWHVFDDRQMYRPGEEVHIKGWIRRFANVPTGDIALLNSGASSVRYSAYDPQGNVVAEDTVDLNALDGFDLAFTLPENINLGAVNLNFTVNGADVAYADYYHTIQVQEFRRPEFAVSAQPEDEGPYYLGDDALVSVSAQYYAGGPLPSAEAVWTVNASAGSYTPPNWDDFVFGVWRPWWMPFDYYSDVGFSDMVYGPSGESEAAPTNVLAGRTDASGKHYLRMEFARAAEPRPYTVNAEAVVMDVNRQAWAASTGLLVHPSEYYVGLRSQTYFVDAGKPLTIEVIVTDVDGNAVPERAVAVTAARQEWVWKDSNWVKQETDVQTCDLVSGNEPESCLFTTDIGGEYLIRAEVRDDRERLNVSELTRWVSGGGRASVPNRSLSRDALQIIPNQEEYAAGDVAELLVQSPFSPAHGLMSVGRNGFVITQTFTITESTATLRIPIEEAWVPNVNVQVDLVGSAPRLDDKGEPMEDTPDRPAFATGTLSLRIPPVSRTLTVDIEPEATELAPGDAAAIDLVATDASGEPVEGAELAVVVVDESILALTGYSIADPLLTFYRDLGAGIDSVYTRDYVVLADPAAIAAAMAGGRGGGGGGDVMMESAGALPAEAPMAAAAPAAEGEMAFDAAPAPMATMTPGMGESAKAANAVDESGAPIDVRTDFNPLAVFAPAITTDAEGRARVEFDLPDNLTRYRVTVVAVTEQEFGKAEANLTARLPLMVRPSAPRFLNFGDRFEFPVVVQNQTDEPLEVSVAMTATNLQVNYMPNMDMPVGPAGQRVTVPANDRVELRFPARPLNAGTARFQVAAAAGDYADAASGELPVYTPATTEAFATYGVVDEGAIVQPVAPPQGVFPQFGGLEINTSSTALSALTDAVLYVYAYPFECSEQIASRVMSIAALRDVLTAFKAEGLPPPEVINDRMNTDIERLQNLQNLDGGWPIWDKGKESVPYYSIFVAHALQEARLKDYAVSDETLSRALDHLRNIESYYPSWYSEITRRTLSSYAVYVRDLMGDTDAARARELLNSKPLEQQSLEAIGWLWQVLSGDPSSAAEVEAIRRHVNNSVVETAGAANFYTSYDDQAWVLLHSNRRTDAIMLDALINDQPESDLIPKVVNGLLANAVDGRWNNTQENVWVLLALDRYFNTFENVEPDFIARVWFGQTYVAEHPYQGYTTDAQQTVLPMSFLLDQFNQGGDAQVETHDLTIQKDGADGRLYYRLGLRYAPTDLELDALDRGFVVARTYEAIDDPADVTRAEDGTWTVKAGARVRVRIQMVADNRRYHVALVDPLPAGFEPINPALAVSESIPGDPTAQPYGWWWYSTWYEHQNLRDSRAEAFTSLLWDGVYEYTYVARATTPGEFAVPPTKAEEMYSPEVFGRSASDKVIVK